MANKGYDGMITYQIFRTNRGPAGTITARRRHARLRYRSERICLPTYHRFGDMKQPACMHIELRQTISGGKFHTRHGERV